MRWLRIFHETTYCYKKAVRFGPHRLILRPREAHDLHVDEMRLEITPDFEVEWRRDLFANSAATVDSRSRLRLMTRYGDVDAGFCALSVCRRALPVDTLIVQRCLERKPRSVTSWPVSAITPEESCRSRHIFR